MAVVNHILDDIGAKQERVMVYNKIDKVSPERLAELQETYGTENCVWISTYTKEWLGDVKELLKKKLVENDMHQS